MAAMATTVEQEYTDGLTQGQVDFLAMVNSGENVYLAGAGGVGKSYVLERLIKHVKQTGKQVIACAPTGIAALNIGGSTIHRTLKISPKDTLTSRQPSVTEKSPIYKCDLLIVDEISMCRLDLFDYLSKALHKAAAIRLNNGLEPTQLVVVGDFSQLPPVVPEREREVLENIYGFDIGGGYAFMGNEWAGWNFKKVELTEIIRQNDSDFIDALTSVRRGKSCGIRWIENHSNTDTPQDAIFLCGLNSEAAKRNNCELAKLKTEPTTYQAHIEGEVNKSDMPTSITLELKPGARVMSLINDQGCRYVNGSLGTVKSCSNDGVVVEFDNGKICNIDRYEWHITKPIISNTGDVVTTTIGIFSQIPLKLAYALTIHKSQGQTFSSAVISPRCWDPGQLYTALSRVRSVDGIHLTSGVANNYLITSKDVLDFYGSTA